MTIFADKEFYKTEYLRGRTAVISLDEVEFWLIEATNKINKRNYSDDELEDIIQSVSESTLNKLRRCTCQVAEKLYTNEQAHGLNRKQSENVGGSYSVAYADQRQTRADIEKNIQSIIIDWLAGTEVHNLLIYRGNI